MTRPRWRRCGCRCRMASRSRADGGCQASTPGGTCSTVALSGGHVAGFDGRLQGLVEVPDDVIDVLDAHRHPDQVGADARRHQRLVGQLLMGGRSRVDDEGAGVADVGQVAGQFDALDEGPAGVAPAAHPEGEDRARAARQIAPGQRVRGGVGQTGVGDPRHGRMAGPGARRGPWRWPRGRPSAGAGSPGPGGARRRSGEPGRCRSRAAARPGARCRTRTRRSCPRTAVRRSWPPARSYAGSARWPT